MLVEVHIVATKSDIEDCHRLGENGSTILQFVNRKFCNVILEKKKLLKNIDKSKLSFANDTKIYVSENLTPYNQRLAWKCRELKRAKKIHKVWSMKGVSKLDDHPMSDHTPFIMMMILDIYFLILFSKRVILQCNQFQFELKYIILVSFCY